ncbi:MAG: hypothetical protein AVDCRST_MAG56-4729, partial [uncultured Cytophagales bacterium]
RINRQAADAVFDDFVVVLEVFHSFTIIATANSATGKH